MDLEQLAQDMKEDPQTLGGRFPGPAGPDKLAKHLLKLHNEMMAGEHGLFGYLYKRQTLRSRQLQQELRSVKNQLQKGVEKDSDSADCGCSDQ